MAKPKTMICLLSDQRMQNVIPVFQKDFDIQKIWMICSREHDQSPKKEFDQRYAQVFKDIEEGLKQTGVEIERYANPVSPISHEEVYNACYEILLAEEKKGRDVWVNITGGTKLMSIGAFLAASDYSRDDGSTIPVVYVDTGSEKIHIFRDEDMEPVDFNLDGLNKENITAMHHFSINEYRTEKNRFTDTELSTAEKILNRGKSGLETMIRLSDEIKPDITQFEARFNDVFVEKDDRWIFDDFIDAKEISSTDEEDVIRFYPISDTAKRPFVSEDSPQGKAKRFFKGTWLEAYVYQALKTSGRFDDVDARISIKGTDDELDVVCIYHGKVGIIETKTGPITEKATDAKKTAIPKLLAHRDTVAGAFGKSFLVIDTYKNDLPESLRQRADYYQITIFDRKDLATIADRIFAEMARTR